MQTVEHILEGDSLQFSRDQKLFAFQVATKAISDINDNNNSEETFAKRSHFITQAFSQKFGGDWACITGKQKDNQSNFSYYIPSIRNICFLVKENHFVFIAQIFEQYKPN